MHSAKHAPEIRSRICQVAGISLNVWEAGPEQGPVLLLLHGFPEAGFAWHAQLQAFAQRGYRVLAPDQRGYNRSSKPKAVGAYRIETLVGDMVALIKATTKNKVTVAGHDWGGGVAWRLAMTHPELVDRLIILNMPHPQVLRQTLRHNGRQRLKSSYALFFQLPHLPEWVSSVANYRLLARTLLRTSCRGTFSDAQIAQYKNAWRQPGALRGMINWYRAYHFFKPLPAGKIVVPTLIIWGEKDAFLLPQMAAPSAAQCTDAKLVMLQKATHWLHHEYPEEVNSLMLDFIKGVG